MLQSDALSILGLTIEATQKDIATAYKNKMKEYHPDINPAGEEMTKLINAANDALEDYDPQKPPKGTTQANYGDDINAALNAIIDLPGLEIEICGAWIWVSGDTRTHKDALKAANFKWASKKKMWNFRPAGWRSSSRGNTTMEDIRTSYGSVKPKWSGPARLSA